jgi:hypothetical protein
MEKKAENKKIRDPKPNKRRLQISLPHKTEKRVQILICC